MKPQRQVVPHRTTASRAPRPAPTARRAPESAQAVGSAIGRLLRQHLGVLRAATVPRWQVAVSGGRSGTRAGASAVRPWNQRPRRSARASGRARSAACRRGRATRSREPFVAILPEREQLLRHDHAAGRGARGQRDYAVMRRIHRARPRRVARHVLLDHDVRVGAAEAEGADGGAALAAAGADAQSCASVLT